MMVLPVLQERQVPLVQQVQLVFKVQPALQERQVSKVPLVQQDQPVQPELTDQPDQQEQLERLV